MPSRRVVHVQVAAVGVPEVRKALRMVAPALARKLTLQIRNEVVSIAAGARAKFEQGETGAGRAGFAVERISPRAGSNGFSGGYRAVNRTREGVLLEHAGSRSQGRTAQGRSLIATLNERHGPPGRYLWSTWDERAGAVQARIGALVRQAQRDLQRTIDSGPVRKG